MWSYGSWIYNYLCIQCLSPLTLWVRTMLMAKKCIITISIFRGYNKRCIITISIFKGDTKKCMKTINISKGDTKKCIKTINVSKGDTKKWIITISISRGDTNYSITNCDVRLPKICHEWHIFGNRTSKLVILFII